MNTNLCDECKNAFRNCIVLDNDIYCLHKIETIKKKKKKRKYDKNIVTGKINTDFMILFD